MPRRSRAVTALVLLAAPAPARVVAADVPVLVHRLALLNRGRDCGRRLARTARRGCDHIGAGCGLVLVGEVAVAALRLQLLWLVHLDLGVEEREHDLLADRAAELLEHGVALGAILDEWILLRHCAQVDPVPEV